MLLEFLLKIMAIVIEFIALVLEWLNNSRK